MKHEYDSTYRNLQLQYAYIWYKDKRKDDESRTLLKSLSNGTEFTQALEVTMGDRAHVPALGKQYYNIGIGIDLCGLKQLNNTLLNAVDVSQCAMGTPSRRLSANGLMNQSQTAI